MNMQSPLVSNVMVSASSLIDLLPPLPWQGRLISCEQAAGKILRRTL
ncbi:MAG: hypothetical protein IPF84_16370 [Proteobacteria bacterium]|nr:hypothetical protein [Pseudomonadota bacterium]